MSLNDNVRAAILRISEVSKPARLIAQRLGLQEGQRVTAADVTDVDALKAQIENLTSQITQLRIIVSSIDTEEESTMTEVQKELFVERFKESLGMQAFPIIASVYDHAYFHAYSPTIRFMMSTALVNWCQERKFEPLDLWYSLMVNNGSM